MLTLLSLALLSPAHAQSFDDAASATDQDDWEVGYDEEEIPEGIINGSTATLDNWPESGALLIQAEIFGQQFITVACTSTLIAPDVVLLAAHCIDPTIYQQQGMDINSASLYWTRTADLSSYATGFQSTPPADAVLVRARQAHQDFSMAGFGIGIADNQDIALLFLDVALTENPMAVLPTPEEAAQVLEGNPVAVVGWGQQTQVSQGQQPPAGTVGVKIMGTSHIAELGASEFKVGEVVTDVRKCHGDSGGPSFMEVTTESTETWRQVGVTSHAYDMTDCASTGGVDTRVDAYLTWIDTEMQAACASGTRVWCEETGILAPPMPEEVEEGKACGCSSSPVSGLGLGLLLLPLVVRRRR